jgi:hypothetical protein
MTIEEAKKFLEEQGYYTECLWSIYDVQLGYECSDEEALKILDKAISCESTYDQIWFNIEYEAMDRGLKPAVHDI